MQYSNSWRTTKDIIIIIVVILIIIAIIVGICVAAKVSTDPYMENRGFVDHITISFIVGIVIIALELIKPEKTC